MNTLLIKLDDSVKDFYDTKKNYTSDSGFDVYTPTNYTIPAKSTVLVNMQIKCQPCFHSGYYLYPRSSVSKTPLRLANSVGIIDKGYRGYIMAAFDNISNEDYEIKKGDRLIQLCHPSLQPMEILFVDELDKTERGEGGFGSTNK